jgi:hypothetical protein
MTRVKICGLKDPDLVRLCAAEGADWIGLVFVEASPRYVTPEAAETLLLGVGKSVPVALLANADDALIDRVTATGIRVLQLHGQESPERVADIAGRTGCEVWKGRFGDFGGRFVAETLMPLILELEARIRARAKTDQSFWAEMDDLWTHYVGRPSPLYFAERLTESWAGRRSTSSATS